ncbi:MAG: DEAD/DEAH box helicase [Planctomycetes bacterium]|nr:DEAD/DEAH box helicase [Planctomycetota bacterium]
MPRSLLSRAGSALRSLLWRTEATRETRRARRALKRLTNEERATRRPIDRGLDRLRRRAEPYVERKRETLLRSQPITALRAFGTKGVRFSVLEANGITTIGALQERDRTSLVAIEGLGEKTAARLLTALERFEATWKDRPVPPPDRDLGEDDADLVVQAGLEVAHARELLGDTPERLSRERERIEQRLAEVERDAGLWRWLGRRWKRQSEDSVREAGKALADDVEQVTDSELVHEARERRRRLKTTPYVAPTAAELPQRYEHTYEELCAIFEGMLRGAGRRGKRIGDAGVRLPKEVVRAVEGVRLVTDGIQVTLRRYQDFGARYVIVQEHTILGDDMGLGKTLQSLTAMNHLAATGKGTHFLVVAPATVVFNWVREIESKTALEPRLVYGTKRDDQARVWLADGGVAVTSYSTLRLFPLAEALADQGQVIDLLVADEAHYLKNPEASRTQAVQTVLAASERTCLMTGTPIENRLSEFQNLVRLIRPDSPAADLGASAEDDEPYVDPAKFQMDVASIYLRRNQEDVLTELPECIEKEEWVELGAFEKKAYREEVEAGNIMGMRRAATVGPKAPHSKRTPLSAKLERLQQIIEEHETTGRKVLVFSYFLDVLQVLAMRFDVIGTIDGSVSARERERILDAFRVHEGHGILLGQITAAGVGLNIQAASIVVLLEPQWKPSIEEQAIARAHRMGQKEKVVVHRFFARDCVDERIRELLEGKQELFELYAAGSAIKDMSRQATETEMAHAVVAVEQARLAREGT